MAPFLAYVARRKFELSLALTDKDTVKRLLARNAYAEIEGIIQQLDTEQRHAINRLFTLLKEDPNQWTSS